jgi:hypothetical protein
MRVYPTGNQKGKGHVSAFVFFDSTDPNLRLEVKVGILVSGRKEHKEEVTIKVGKGSTFHFGNGIGRSKFCEMSDVFTKTKTIVAFKVEVLQVIEQNGDKKITSHPAGRKEYAHKSKAELKQLWKATKQEEKEMERGNKSNKWFSLIFVFVCFLIPLLFCLFKEYL